MGQLRIENNKDPLGQDEMNIGRRGINARLNIYKFMDRDTMQYVTYCPALEISGYGATEKEADDMIGSSFDDLFEMLFRMPSNNRERELARLGWHKKRFFNKQFSKAFVDMDGELQNFNAKDIKIQRATVAA